MAHLVYSKNNTLNCDICPELWRGMSAVRHSISNGIGSVIVLFLLNAISFFRLTNALLQFPVVKLFLWLRLHPGYGRISAKDTLVRFYFKIVIPICAFLYEKRNA